MLPGNLGASGLDRNAATWEFPSPKRRFSQHVYFRGGSLVPKFTNSPELLDKDPHLEGGDLEE